MDAATEQFIEKMGRSFEADGIPRIGGRLFGFLLLQEQPCSLDDLAEVLRVSKTSISTNARLLERRGMVELTTRPGDRRDYYVVSGDLIGPLELRLAHVREMEALLREAPGTLPTRSPVVRERLRRMGEVTGLVVERLTEVLREARGNPSG